MNEKPNAAPDVEAIMALADQYAKASAAEQNDAIACGWGSQQHEDAGEKTYRCEAALRAAVEQIVRERDELRDLLRDSQHFAGALNDSLASRNRDAICEKERAERIEVNCAEWKHLASALQDRLVTAEQEAAALRQVFVGLSDRDKAYWLEEVPELAAAVKAG